MNPNGDPNAPENGGEGAKASTTPTTSPENSVRGRSRLNPNGDPNAPENGGAALPPKSNDVGSKPTVVTTPQQATSSTETKKGGYLELLQALDPYKPPTAEELEKEKRKQKRDSVIAAIGDGVAALSNLYFTTQGAPNMYDGKNTMSEAVKVRYDKLLKDRDNKQKEYFNNYIKMKQLDDAAANNERSWQRLLAEDEAKRKAAEDEAKRKEAEAKRKEILAQLDIQLKLGSIDEQTYKTEKAKIEAGKAGEVQQSIINRNNNSGRKAEFLAYDKDGKEHYFHSQSAAEAFARQNGTWVEDEYEEETETEEENFKRDGSSSGKSKKKTTVKKKGNGRSVKPEPKKKANPMGD